MKGRSRGRQVQMTIRSEKLRREGRPRKERKLPETKKERQNKEEKKNLTFSGESCEWKVGDLKRSKKELVPIYIITPTIKKKETKIMCKVTEEHEEPFGERILEIRVLRKES